METSEKKALVEIYKMADKKTKKAMEDKFGKETLAPKPDDSIITWEQVAKIKKLHPVNILPYPKPKNDRHNRMNEHYIMDVMVEHFNTDADGKVWEPTINDLGSRVWFIKSGVGFVFDLSFDDYDGTSLGSRLHFKNNEIADRAAKSLQYHQNRLFKTSK
jgi:hypothetical protein